MADLGGVLLLCLPSEILFEILMGDRSIDDLMSSMNKFLVMLLLLLLTILLIPITTCGMVQIGQMVLILIYPLLVVLIG